MPSHALIAPTAKSAKRPMAIACPAIPATNPTDKTVTPAQATHFQPMVKAHAHHVVDVPLAMQFQESARAALLETN
jgi:hypothetical protein